MTQHHTTTPNRFVILSSAVVAGYKSISQFFHPHDISHLWTVAIASGIGFLAALIADGQHIHVRSTSGWGRRGLHHQYVRI
jgi:hypothetical protein